MPYTKGANAASGPYIAAGNISYQQANNLETEYTEAVLSLGPDAIAAFVLSGGVCTKDGTTASQLDVTTCTAYIIQPVDASGQSVLRQRVLNSTTFSCSGHPSATLFLDLNPDGTTSFGTSHSAVANHLTLCTVATDGSSNISTVTDTRPTILSLFPNFTGGDIQLGGRHIADCSLANMTIFNAQSLPGGGMQKYDVCVLRSFA